MATPSYHGWSPRARLPPGPKTAQRHREIASAAPRRLSGHGTDRLFGDGRTQDMDRTGLCKTDSGGGTMCSHNEAILPHTGSILGQGLHYFQRRLLVGGAVMTTPPSFG